jgi:YidC/Oxa1 family membrane protein insertase
MMRPANQPKSTDPQQAMMNSVMNIMPLTVVFFGWSFASGPVLYWATQSVYSVIQQWFITGWGNFNKWAPFLPELPEHRRLGYRPPRDLDSVVVVSGDGQPVFAPGPMGWLQRKMDEAQKQALQRTGGAAASGDTTTSGDGKADAIEVDAAPVAGATGNGSSRTRSRNGKRKGGGKGTAATATTGSARPQGRDNGAAVSAPTGAVIVPRKAKPVSQENRGE